MNAGISASHGSSKALDGASEFRMRIADWHRQLEWCGKAADRKCVHKLRVATQRLLAELEYCGAHQKLDRKAARTLRRWLKLGNKLRRAMSPVRDADVCLEMLARLHKANKEEAQQWPEGQLTALLGTLQRVRKHAAKKLVEAIEDRAEQAAKLSGQLAERLAEPMCRLQKEAPTWLVPLLEGMAEEFSQLDAANLHGFRKRIKQVRSLAEVAASTENGAREKAGLLREIQAAIGQWRDLQVLAHLARRKRAMRLTELIAAKAEKALAAALDCCQHGAVKLAKSA